MSKIETDSPESLLGDFLREDRSERAFARLVKSMGGLVYGVAFRRTGDASLAEEVSQTVFTILAQKAESLRYHTSLSSWLYRTTSFEAEKSLRKEIRHRRRIEKFANDAMNDSPEEQFSPDTLKLLEQSIDCLGEKDRRLLLSRFFEGKKFREIAEETRQSEAACKVRLRRVLDKMGGWLNRRGCTLSVTVLGSLLASEWARACPVPLSPNTHLFLKGSTISTTAFVPKITAAMKISKMTAAGLALLLVAATAPLVLDGGSKGVSEKASESKVTISNGSNADRRTRSARSLEGMFTNYPYAHERLEELYQKYPNLRLPEFVPTKEVTLLDELARYLEGIESKEFKIPGDLQRQLNGEGEWDAGGVAAFLEGRKEFIDGLLEISNLSTRGSRFRYLISESSPEIFQVRSIGSILSLAFLNEVRRENPGRAEEIFEGMLRYQEASSKPFLIHSLVANTTQKHLQGMLRDLAKDGYDVRFYAQQLEHHSVRESLLDGLRLEVGSFISILETAKSVDDRVALQKHLAPMISGVGSEISPADQILMGKEAMNWDLNEFQDDYARVLSGIIAGFPDPMNTDAMVEGGSENAKLKVSSYGLSKGRELILESIIPKVDGFARQVFEIERLRRELGTWNALNQATASGVKVNKLSELVPEFLPEVPINPRNNEPFVFDAEAWTLEVQD